MDIGENIKKYRLLKNMTQKQLAKKAGVAEITIRQYESGKRVPKTVQLFSVADALGITPFDLRGEPIPTSYNDGKISFFDQDGNETLRADPVELQRVVNEMVNKVHPTNESLLLNAFEKLNMKGKNEALKRVNELTEIKKYTEKD